MDALEFLKERKRMCNSYKNCGSCPFAKSHCVISHLTSDEGCERIIATVEQWSKEHPRKTRQSVFLEQYPEAKRVNNILAICPKVLDMNFPCWIYNSANVDCEDCRREFWMKEAE